MESNINPYIEASIAETKKQDNLNTRRHKFSVHGIYIWGKSIKEEAYDSARIYCKQNHIEFIMRDFFDGFIEDREIVERIPAFHIYYEGEYKRTFYKGNELEDILQELIEEMKENKRDSWSHTVTQWISQSMNTLNLPVLRSSKTRIVSSLPND